MSVVKDVDLEAMPSSMFVNDDDADCFVIGNCFAQWIGHRGLRPASSCLIRVGIVVCY